MEIERIVSTYLQKGKTEKEECVIRISIRWRFLHDKNLQNVVINVGHKIDREKWDSSQSRVKKRVLNKKLNPAFEINKSIQHKLELIDKAFKKFEVEEVIPTKTELRDTINYLLGKHVGKPRELITFQDAFKAYLIDCSKTKSHKGATYAKLKTLQRIFKQFDPELKLHQLTKEKLNDYVDFLLVERSYQNATVKKNLTFVKTFLDYCEQRNLINTNWKEHSVELKTISGKDVIFLNKDELEKVYTLKLPEHKKYLERTRDVFCFQCMTSLRYSDVKSLKKSDIVEGALHVVTEKTDDKLIIPLSAPAQQILSRYKDFDKEKALPVISNQKMNEYIKEVCFLAGIDQTITKTYYKGRERINETFKKYEQISSHTGRRTFICIALAEGVTPQTVMKITGHSDYKSMQPYIDVTDTSKQEAVNIFTYL